MASAVSVSPRFIECHADDEMRAGWHIARRHDWTDQGRFEVVFLDIQEDADGTRFGVWRAGGPKPEDAMEWAFAIRIGGFRSMPEDPIEMKARVLH